MHVRRLQITDGWILYNDIKTPITVHGGDLVFGIDSGGTLGHPLYVGNLNWQNLQFTSKKYVPLPVSLSAKFTVWREGFALEQGIFSVGRSHLDAQAEMSNSGTAAGWNCWTSGKRFANRWCQRAAWMCGARGGGPADSSGAREVIPRRTLRFPTRCFIRTDL
jgi:hypothetical protein